MANAKKAIIIHIEKTLSKSVQSKKHWLRKVTIITIVKINVPKQLAAAIPNIPQIDNHSKPSTTLTRRPMMVAIATFHETPDTAENFKRLIPEISKGNCNDQNLITDTN